MTVRVDDAAICAERNVVRTEIDEERAFIPCRAEHAAVEREIDRPQTGTDLTGLYNTAVAGRARYGHGSAGTRRDSERDTALGADQPAVFDQQRARTIIADGHREIGDQPARTGAGHNDAPGGIGADISLIAGDARAVLDTHGAGAKATDAQLLGVDP